MVPASYRAPLCERQVGGGQEQQIITLNLGHNSDPWAKYEQYP